MRLTLTFLLLIFLNIIFVSTAKKLKDADFSEFDNFDDDEFAVESPLPSNANPSNKVESISLDSSTTSNKNSEETIVDVTVDDEDDDDDRMFDDEEFENTESFSSSSSTPDLKFTEVPSNLTGNRWEAYYCEGIMIIALLGYLINFLLGRAKNARLASNIYRSQSDLLEKNFSLIGDNGQTRTTENNDEQTNNDLSTTNLQKESENLYILWCSGRISIESMLMEIRLIKRQCLFNSLVALIKSINDTIVYTIDFSKEDMETFVFCLAKKRSAIRLHRDMNDLSQFCAERKNADRRGLTSGNYQILSEFGEVTSAIVDNRLVDFIDKYPDALEYIHITDQYTGSKNQNENLQSNTTNAPQQQDALNASERAVRRVLIIAFNLLARDDRSLQVTSEYVASDYLRLVLHLIDRVSSYRFQSKETKLKANKNRQRIEEQFLKNVYQQRQEQAQQRREEKRRAEKEKIMQSDDSERQRKWEEKEHKRELKRRQPKMKQMKVKSM